MKRKRRYGSGSVFKNGRTWWLKYSVRGQQIRENSYLGDRDAADALLKQRVAEAAAGMIDTALKRVTIADICRLALDDAKLRKMKDAATVAWRFEAHIKDTLGKIQAARATSTQINAYIKNRREKSAAEATINRELSIVRRAYTLAMREEPPLIRKAPYIPKLDEDNVRQGFIEQAQYERLLGELPDELKAIFVCGYYVGCRKNELRLLTWEQVDFADGEIRIYGSQTKNGKPRTIPIYHGDMETWLRTQYAARPEGNPFVFYGARKRPIGDHLDGWHEACGRAEMAGLYFHDLRRSAIRNMERAGIPRSVAMKISGHLTESVYKRYDIVSRGDIDTAKKKLAEYTKLGINLGIVAGKKKTGSDL
jgi:integrase